jgi:hypothetical protein
LTKSYLENHCRQWINLRTPSKMLFGGVTADSQGRLTEVKAMR